MFVIRRSFGSQRGDTLVEVLIAIAVVSLVLGGAYVTTNRSLLATRAAQERAIALKLAEGQIERIKGLVDSNPDAVFGTTAPSPFCISSNTGLPASDGSADCAVNTSGAASTAEPLFHLSIVRSNNDFVLTETWENVNGKIIDSLQLRYRVYE